MPEYSRGVHLAIGVRGGAIREATSQEEGRVVDASSFLSCLTRFAELSIGA